MTPLCACDVESTVGEAVEDAVVAGKAESPSM